MENRFLQAVHSGRVLLMDGAMGTELLARRLQAGACTESATFDYQLQAHYILELYCAAGAECVLTNTFQANPVALAAHEIQDQLESICDMAVNLAELAVSAPDCYPNCVLGDIGPFDPPTEASLLRIVKALRIVNWLRVVQALPHGILLETWSDSRPIAPTRSAMDVVVGPAWPLLVSFTFLHDTNGELATAAGFSPEQLAQETMCHNVTALGVNCGRDISMDDCTEIIRRYRTQTDLPLFARPNAGTPTQIDGQWVYPHTPEQMAAKLPALLEAGVSMVGGCCGTTPAHIAAFRPVVDMWNAKRR